MDFELPGDIRLEDSREAPCELRHSHLKTELTGVILEYPLKSMPHAIILPLVRADKSLPLCCNLLGIFGPYRLDRGFDFMLASVSSGVFL